MKKLILFFSLYLLLFKNDSVNVGACVHTYYRNGSFEENNNCYNDYEKDLCSGIDFGYEYDWTWYKGSTCQEEGYTKGCGGSFTAEDENC